MYSTENKAAAICLRSMTLDRDGKPGSSGYMRVVDVGWDKGAVILEALPK